MAFLFRLPVQGEVRAKFDGYSSFRRPLSSVVKSSTGRHRSPVCRTIVSIINDEALLISCRSHVTRQVRQRRYTTTPLNYVTSLRSAADAVARQRQLCTRTMPLSRSVFGVRVESLSPSVIRWKKWNISYGAVSKTHIPLLRNVVTGKQQTRYTKP